MSSLSKATAVTQKEQIDEAIRIIQQKGNARRRRREQAREQLRFSNGRFARRKPSKPPLAKRVMSAFVGFLTSVLIVLLVVIFFVLLHG